MKLGLFALATFMAASPTAAWAQSQCSDVLKDGVYSYDRYHDDSSFNQIAYSRFLRSDYNSARTDREGGFGIPVGEVLLGGDFSEENYRLKKSQIDSTYFNQINASREIDIALMSGDEEVLSAWRACMADQKGGLTVRFEPLSATDVFMIVEYFNQGTRNREKLATTFVVPEGVTITNNAKCLKKGTVLENGKSCTATLKLDSALRTFAVNLDGQGSEARAWLPARIQLSRSTQPYTFGPHPAYSRNHKVGEPVRSAVASLTGEQLKDGWLFVPNTARSGVNVISVNNSNNRCYNPYAQATITRFEYGYTVHAPNRHHNDGQIECEATPYILMERSVWVPWMQEKNTADADSNKSFSQAAPDINTRKSVFGT